MRTQRKIIVEGYRSSKLEEQRQRMLSMLHKSQRPKAVETTRKNRETQRRLAITRTLNILQNES